MLETITHLIFGYFGLGMVLTAAFAAGAFFITAIVPPPFGVSLSRYLFEAAVISAIATTIYGKGYFDDQAQWDKAVANQIDVDNRARADAQRDAASGVSDGHDRDKQSRGLRSVESH